MDDFYKQLGFKYPDFLENPYGIRIYIGTKGKDDWSVEIPKELCTIKCSCLKYDKNITFYLISEEDALKIAKEYTKAARQI